MRIILGIFMMIVAFSCNNKRMKVISGLEGQSLPSYDLLLTDSVTHLNTNDIPKGQPFVLFYFSPFCPYCRAQTEQIKNEIETMKDVRFYFLAGFSLNKIRKYDQQYGLSNYKNITIAQIRDTSFGKYFRIQGVPYTAIYDKEKKLKEVLPGKYDINVIREIALNNKH